jgi:hypothetical protein
MNRFDEPIVLTNETEPCFLCTWNDGDIVEIHTQQTLHAKYDDTNLFDGDLPFINHDGDDIVISLQEWLDTIECDRFDRNAIYCDNFSIQRIK